MKRRFAGWLLGLAAFAGAGVFCQQAAAAPAPVEAFARLPQFRDVRVSPSGERFMAVYRAAGATEYSFAVFDRSDGLKVLFSTRESDDLRISSPVWKRDDLILFTVYFAANRFGTDTTETRSFSLQPETGEVTPLFGRPGRGELQIPVQIQSNFVSMLPDDPEHVLLQYLEGEYFNVYSVPVDRTGRHNIVMRGRKGIFDWSADKHGVVRSGRGADGDQPRLIFLTGDGEVDASHRVAGSTTTFSVVGFPPDPDKAYVVSNARTDTTALYLYDIPTDTLEEELFHSPVSDVLGITSDRDGNVLAVTFAEETGEIHWFGDSFVRTAFDQLKQTFPGREVDILDVNEADTFLVAHVSSASEPGRDYLFDLTGPRLTALPPDYPELEGVEMGPVVATSYEARDGLTIPAFVTLPPGTDGLEAARGLPFVLLPHGGPTSRDYLDFDWQAQFLASRGYGVLQMNFRGSYGYGEAFRAAGDKEWGQAMQDDITDGAQWLVDQGHADPERLAIMGASYGGYAALMGVVKTPDLYQCAVTHGAVTDLPALLNYQDNYVGGEYGTRHIGDLWSDRSMLRENSPALHADRITVPVLMFHGEDDRVVDLDQAKRMEQGFKRQGGDYLLFVLPQGSHGLDVGDNRLTYLREVEAFLEDCLGG